MRQIDIFGDTMSKGKNDNVFQTVCQTYITKHYDILRGLDGKEPIKLNVTCTDNYPTQYKCHKNFCV